MTPDKVETRIGTMDFFDGMPTAEIVQKVYDNLDFLRGVEVFLNGIPATSIEGLQLGIVEAGATESNQVIIMDKLLDSTPLFLTGNTDTVYATGIIDLGKDGPTIMEILLKCGPGTVNDASFRFITDMGIPGPDQGKGGKLDGNSPRGKAWFVLLLLYEPLEPLFDNTWQPGELELVE
jgi:hypothetical protein